jgi:hypothetical protein
LAEIGVVREKNFHSSRSRNFEKLLAGRVHVGTGYMERKSNSAHLSTRQRYPYRNFKLEFSGKFKKSVIGPWLLTRWGDELEISIFENFR